MAARLWRTFTSCAKSLQINSEAKPLRLRDMADLFLPPVNRSMKELDRSFFKKTIPLAAAYIQNPRAISAVRNTLTKSHEMLRIGQIKPLQDDPNRPGAKALILQPHVKPSGA